MDEVYIFLIAVVILSVIAFFLSSFYVKKKTKDMDLEEKKALYIKSKKTRKLFGYFILAYMIINMLISLLLHDGLGDSYQIYNMYYTYSLGLIFPIGFFYLFNYYRLERIVFGRIL